MVTNVHVTRIFEKSPANEIEGFISDLNIITACDELQDTPSWISFLNEQHNDIHIPGDKIARKYPIRVFSIQPEA